MLRVDIGCGDTKPAGFVGVDIFPGPGVDIVADISKTFPFDDSSVDELRAYDVVEHLPDRINTMNEIWRVCKPGASVDIFVPSTDGRGAFQDPTHISFWNINSFLYYNVDCPPLLRLCHKYGFKGAFKVLSLEHVDSGSGITHVRAQLEAVKPAPDFHLQAWAESAIATTQATQPPLESTPQPIQIAFPQITPAPAASRKLFWSVIIPVYNPKLDYFRQTLESLLVQAEAHSSMQIEVVDDASTQEGIEAFVQEIGQGRISYSRNPKNLGLIGNWNACINRATGEWVHLLHQDDIVLPGFYTQLGAAIAKQAEVGAAFCRHFHIDETGEKIYESPLESDRPGILEQWLPKIASVQRIQFAAMVVRRSTYEKLGGFYPEARSAADWEMWKRISTYFSIWFEPQTLACYRLHRRSESSRLVQQGENITDTLRAIEISETYLPKAIAATVSQQAREHYAQSALYMAQHLLTQGELAGAIAQIRAGLRCSQAPQITAQLISLLLSTEPGKPLTPQLADLNHQLAQYRQSASPEVLTKLTEHRRAIAHQLLNTSSKELESLYCGDLGTAHQTLLSSNFR